MDSSGQEVATTFTSYFQGFIRNSGRTHQTPFRLSFGMHAKYHLPSHTAQSVYALTSPYLQKSNYPKVKLAAGPHCAARHCKMPMPGCQYRHGEDAKRSGDIRGPPVSQLGAQLQFKAGCLVSQWCNSFEGYNA